jgi:protein involved in temperature-dependent protein secretion
VGMCEVDASDSKQGPVLAVVNAVMYFWVP